MMEYDRSISLDDRMEIAELYARYCLLADRADAKNWPRCFTEDGTFRPTVGPEPGRTYRGREELSAFIVNSTRFPLRTRHWSTGLILRSNGDVIRGTTYAFLLRAVGENDPQIYKSLVYSDQLKKEDGAWKFFERLPSADNEATPSNCPMADHEQG